LSGEPLSPLGLAGPAGDERFPSAHKRPADQCRRDRPPVANAFLFRRSTFWKRYNPLGGRAMTGSLVRKRWTSIATPLAVSYRRVRSFSKHFITIQSRSPRNRLMSLDASEEEPKGSVLTFYTSREWLSSMACEGGAPVFHLRLAVQATGS
jgi:hypothetical protein